MKMLPGGRGSEPLNVPLSEALDILEERGCQREGRGCSIDSPSKLCPTCSILASVDARDRRLAALAPRLFGLLKRLKSYSDIGALVPLLVDASDLISTVEDR